MDSLKGKRSNAGVYLRVNKQQQFYSENSLSNTIRSNVVTIKKKP